MKYIRILLTVVFGLLYWPINMLHTRVQRWYFAEKKKDIVIWYLFTPFYALLVVITTIISVPYEMVAKNLH